MHSSSDKQHTSVDNTVSPYQMNSQANKAPNGVPNNPKSTLPMKGTMDNKGDVRDTWWKNLCCVKPTQDDVKTCAGYVGWWKDSAAEVCDVVTACFCRSDASNENRLAIFYVMNEILQSPNGNAFLKPASETFFLIIAPLVAHSTESRRYLKTVSVLQQRSRITPTVASKLRSIYSPPEVLNHEIKPSHGTKKLRQLINEVDVKEHLVTVGEIEAATSSTLRGQLLSQVKSAIQETLDALYIAQKCLLEWSAETQSNMQNIEQLSSELEGAKDPIAIDST